MAVSKVILNGNTLIDVTQKTVDSGNLLYGETALKNDGTSITGSYTPNVSELEVKSGKYWEYYVGREPDGNALFSDNLSSSQTKTISPSLAIGDVYFASISAKNTGDADWTFTREEYFQGCPDDEPWWIEGEANVRIGDTTVQTDYSHFDINHVEIYATQKTVDGYNPVSVAPLHLQYSSVYPDEVGTVVTPVGDFDGIAEVTVYPISTTYVGSGIPRNDSTDLTRNGATITAPAGYYASSASRSVVSGTEGTPVATKGTVSSHSVTVTPSVTNVAGYISGGSKTGTAVTVSASELVSGTKSITSNGTNIDVTDYEAVDVSVNPSLQAKAGISPTTSSQTISADSGYYGLSRVQINAMPSGTAGTPTATKGTVSNHSIAVTPSVTNTTGYITGGTINGTAATVSASELVSGTKSITANGTGIDVTDYASVDVAVPGGTIIDALNVTTNGTYTAQSGHAYSPVTVNVGGEDPDAVLFYDYDGTVLHRYSKTEFNALSAMPANPTHTGLTSQGWNWSLSDAKAHLVNHSQLDIGQCYITSDGVTRFYITLGANDLDLGFMLTTSKADALTIDWGDGSTPDVIGKVNLEIINHTYSTTGDYIIEATCTSGTWYPIPYSGTNSQAMRPFFGPDKKEILTGVMLGNNLNGAGTGYAGIAFGGNINLEFVTMPTYYTTSQTSYEFLGCGKLKQLTLPYGRTKIHSYAFYQCLALKSVSIPNTVTSIEGSAFYYNVFLERLPLPDSITSIATNNFQYFVSLKKFELPTSITSYSGSLSYNGYITSVTIPSTVTTYGASFSYCERLESVTLPSGVTQAGSYSNCYNIKSFTIPSPVTTISSSAFSGCYGLTSLTIPSGVTTINGSAFYNCYQLRSLSIPSGVSNLETNTFSGCYMLESIELPSGIKIADNKTGIFNSCYNLKSVSVGFSGTTIPTNTFMNCYSLESFTIPNTIETIKSGAFSYCYSLRTITIPSSITSIESSAFSNCHSMQEYHLLPTTPPTLANSNAFSNIPSTCVIYVPSASLDAYKTASNWSTYASKMVGE